MNDYIVILIEFAIVIINFQEYRMLESVDFLKCLLALRFKLKVIGIIIFVRKTDFKIHLKYSVIGG